MKRRSLRTRLKVFGYAVVGSVVSVSNPALAAGLEKLKTTTTSVFDGIDAASIAIVALAILFAGLGMVFRWVTLQVAGFIVGGAIIAGSALEISTFLFA